MGAAYRSEAVADLLAVIEDTPANVDFRGTLLRPDAWARAAGADGWVFGAPGVGLICVWGSPDDDTIYAALREHADATLLVPAGEQRGLLAALLAAAGQACEIHTAPDDGWPQVAGTEVAHWYAREHAALEHVPAELAAELRDALDRSAVCVSLADGVPAGFCYAHLMTERYWDVSVDTLSAHRRAGHATRAFRAQAALQAARGRSPVWGSLRSNTASMDMARQLGFAPTASLWCVSEAGSRGLGGG